MALHDQLMEDLKAAMRQGDTSRREAIRMIRAALLNEQIERQHPLSDDESAQVLRRIVSRHEDSIEQFERGGRVDLVEHEQAQVAVVKAYLDQVQPEQMSRSAIEAHVRSVIDELGVSNRGELGRLMQRLAADLRGKADLKEVNRVAQELLSA